MTNLLFVALFSLATLGAAQEFQFAPTAAQDDTALSDAMSHLATQVMATYHDDDRETYLDNLFRLQMVAELYDKAAETIATLRQMRAPKIPGGGEWVNVQYEIFARAKEQPNPLALRPCSESLEDRMAWQRMCVDCKGVLHLIVAE
jgi:uncharacterized protein